MIEIVESLKKIKLDVELPIDKLTIGYKICNMIKKL